MPHLRYAPALRGLVSAVSSLLLVGVVSAQAASDATNIDARWNRSWPAGPFSQVSTSWGSLQTSIPIVELKGRCGTSIGLAIYHRSNATAGTQLAATDAGAGRGWLTSATQTLQSGTGGLTWFQGGNATQSWQVATVTNGVPTYKRTPGTRADLYPIMSGSIVAGWRVVDQATKAQYYFQQPLVAQTVYRLSKVVEPHGWQVTYSYDANNRPTRITDTSGQRYIQLTYTTDQNAQLQQATLYYPSGSKTWDFAYSNWYLASVTYPAPSGTTRPSVGFHYTNEANIDDIYDLRGSRWHFAYGSVFQGYLGVSGVYPPYLSSPTTNWDATGTTFSWSTYTSGTADTWTKTCTITDRRGWNWKHVYYNNGGNDWFTCPIKETWDGGLVAHDSYTWNYTDATVASHTDRRGYVTSYQYDPNNHGLLVQKTDRENWVWKYLYANDKLVTEIAPTGNRKTYVYNTTTWDLQKTTEDPTSDPYDGSYSKPSGVALTTNYGYDSYGNLTSVNNGSDTATTYSNYDAYGDAWTVTNPAGVATTFTYDDLGNKRSVTEPAPGGTTNFGYDNWNRPTTTTFPGNGAYTQIGYDNNGNKTSVRDENGHTSTLTYDAYNRLSGTRQPTDSNSADDIVVSYGYDVDGNRTSATNGRGKVTTYAFGSRNELGQITYPDSTTRKFHYDGNGNRDQRTDGQNRTTSYAYDKENRLTTTTYPDSSTTTNYWRSDGLRYQLTDPTGNTVYGYNGALQLTSVAQPLPNKTVSYTYDSGGRRKTMAVGAQTWTYYFDAAYRPDHVTQTVGAATPVTYSYKANSLLDTRTNGNGTKTVYGYDVRDRVTSISHQNASGVEEQRLSNTYDDAGNVQTYGDTIVGGQSWSTTYGYDWSNRLTSEVRTGGSSFNYSTSYAYDKNGNRASVTRDGSMSTYSVDDNDKLLSGDGFTFSGYSNDGNPSTVAGGGITRTLTYDYDNRVKTLAYSSGGTDTFRYDGDGKRVEKIDASGTTRFVYDGSTVVAETDGSGNITSYYLPGVGWVTAGAQRYFRENALGSNVATTNASGTVDSRTEYDAYGVEFNVSSGTKSSFRFAGGHGYYTDVNSGMDLLGARYYLPKLGRFLTQDPLGHDAGLNLYQYCEGNPLAKTDPDGKEGQIFVAGDTSGNAMWSTPIYWFAAMGWHAPYYNGLSKQQFSNVLMHAKEAVIFGHGSTGSISIDSSTNVNATDISAIAERRRRLGMPKLKSITIDECHVMRDGNMINALLDLSDEVHGFIGWTVDPDTHWLGQQYVFRQKVDPVAWRTQQKNYRRYVGHGVNEGAP